MYIMCEVWCFLSVVSLIVSFSRDAVEADGEQFVEHQGSDTSSSHLQLDQLGCVLKSISTIVPGKTVPPFTESRKLANNFSSGAVDEQRSFDTSLLKAGLPNLLVTAPGKFFIVYINGTMCN